ncbi:MAG TPA: hypothetical protein VNO31_03060 [Umezawaea sp.]|nr:hypothetical protein [Umezawaea sp.]
MRSIPPLPPTHRVLLPAPTTHLDGWPSRPATMWFYQFFSAPSTVARRC